MFALMTLCLIGVVFMVRGQEGRVNPRPKKNPPTSASPSDEQPAVSAEVHLGSVKPLSYYSVLYKGRGVFRLPSEETETAASILTAPEWGEINVVRIFRVTEDAAYSAQIRIDGRTLFLEEGETFDEYEVSRIDAIRNTVTIQRREWGDSKTFKVRILSEE